MKILRFNESFLDSEQVNIGKRHKFLEETLIRGYFVDFLDKDYQFGFKGYYRHTALTIDGYDPKDGSRVLRGFNLKFYKDLGKFEDQFRKIEDISDDLSILNQCIHQYLACSEFDDDYEFVGVSFGTKRAGDSVQGDPNFRHLQILELQFKNITRISIYDLGGEQRNLN